MNTVAKGDLFEEKAVGIIQKVLDDGLLGVMKEYAQVFTKKGYYSPTRKGNIVFDLTIEIWPPGATNYVSIYIIECKNYDHRVPVDDVEEFHDKVLQVTGVNCKAIMITNSPFQRGAFNVAESNRIMVLQANCENDYEIILYKRNQNNNEGLIPYTVRGETLDEGEELLHTSIDNLIISAFKKVDNPDSISYGIEKLSKEDISRIAKTHIQRIDSKILDAGHQLSLELFKKYLETNFGLNIEITTDESIIGSCDIPNKTIRLSSKIVSTDRELFTLAHEFGHFVLHQKLEFNQALYDIFSDPIFNFRTNTKSLKNERHWIEWQANYFAACLCMPKILIVARLKWCQQRLDIPEGKAYIDDQPTNIKNFSNLINKMSYMIGVSKTSIIYRLKELELYENRSRLKSLGEIIHEYQKDIWM